MSRDFRGITGPLPPLFHGSLDNSPAPFRQQEVLTSGRMSAAFRMRWRAEMGAWRKVTLWGGVEEIVFSYGEVCWVAV